jgi:calcium-independent phospholipase A2
MASYTDEQNDNDRVQSLNTEDPPPAENSSQNPPIQEPVDGTLKRRVALRKKSATNMVTPPMSVALSTDIMSLSPASIRSTKFVKTLSAEPQSTNSSRPLTAVESIKQLKLHYPENAERLLKYLQANKYDQMQRDHNGDTPLHTIIVSGRADKQECLKVLMIYSIYGADHIDSPCNNGNTALHLATQLGDVQVVKVLLAFGANVDHLNAQKKTPLDYAAENQDDQKFKELQALLTAIDAKSGKEVLAELIKGADETYGGVGKRSKILSFSSHMPELQEKVHSPLEKQKVSLSEYMSSSLMAGELEKHLNNQYSHYNDIIDIDYQVVLGLQQFELQGWKSTASLGIKFQVLGGSRILCLDGGGMRGLIQIEILSIIERLSGRKIVDLFDWIIGTSTGGIVALGLVYGKKSLSELRQIYFKLKEEIFAKSGFGIGYNTEALEKILKSSFDSKMKMSDIKEPKVLISAVLKKTTNLQLCFFNNCFNDEYSDELVWKVARYTSAAPMNFSECDNFVDGGVLANNPSEYGLTAIQNYHRQEHIKLNIACVVSVGTGIFPAEKLGSTSAHEGVFDLLSFKRKAANLMTLISKALVESEDVATNSRSRCEEQHIPFFRFSPNLDSEVDSGETKDEVLIDMLITTKFQVSEIPCN